jgi:hypothetical protein
MVRDADCGSWRMTISSSQPVRQLAACTFLSRHAPRRGRQGGAEQFQESLGAPGSTAAVGVEECDDVGIRQMVIWKEPDQITLPQIVGDIPL